jgi:uracil-DNA glycosylase
VIVTLGVTAGQSLSGSSFRVGATRGTPVPWRLDGRASGGARRPEATAAGGHEFAVIATVHTSAVLRAADRDSAYAGLVDDLTVVARSP